MNNSGGVDTQSAKWLLMVIVASIMGGYTRTREADPAIEVGAAAISSARDAHAARWAPSALAVAEDILQMARQSSLAGDERSALRLAREATLEAQRAQEQAQLATILATAPEPMAPLALRRVGYRANAAAAPPVR